MRETKGETVMKYMFASDIHGSAYYCKKMLDAFEKEGAERLVLLGDLLYHGPRNDLPRDYAPKQVISMLNAMKDRIYAVRGNCEAEVDQMVLDFPVMADYCILSSVPLPVPYLSPPAPARLSPLVPVLPLSFSFLLPLF